MKKWRNGKYEQVVFESGSLQLPYKVMIYDRDFNGRIVLVLSAFFSNRPLAVAYAARHRLSRMCPNRLFRIDEIYSDCVEWR